MAAVRWFKYAYLAFASQPKSDRELYRLVKARRAARIVELGIGDLTRSVRLIEVAQRYAGDQKVCYTGLDWFDTRTAELPPLFLKQAHQVLQATGAQIRLVPGPPGQTLPGVANAHLNTGLLLISQALSTDDLHRAWFYIPRMLRDESVVLQEVCATSGRPAFIKLSASELAERAGRAAPRRAA